MVSRPGEPADAAINARRGYLIALSATAVALGATTIGRHLQSHLERGEK